MMEPIAIVGALGILIGCFLFNLRPRDYGMRAAGVVVILVGVVLLVIAFSI